MISFENSKKVKLIDFYKYSQLINGTIEMRIYVAFKKDVNKSLTIFERNFLITKLLHFLFKFFNILDFII